MDKDVGKPASEWRTSQSTFLRAAEDEMMIDLERRTASLTRISRTHQEDLQVLRYEVGQKYSAHTDYFDARNYQKDPHTLKLIENGRRNRLATVFWYLSDVDQGGETEFPRVNGAPQPWDLDTCGNGLKVKPERGKVIIFYSLHPDGEGDPLSLHAACPVEKGIKWAANKWVWNAPMSFIQDE
jgi:prolyl 4-hydroxylase